ncbi:hypothetical protein HYR99_20505 [Candidatus Poribacteria bacterium]|nr:hypothetical protein [Candidatus Poribacteria bacterium]
MERTLEITPLVEMQLLTIRNEAEREKLLALFNRLARDPNLLTDSKPLSPTEPDGSGLYMRWLDGDICLIFTVEGSTISLKDQIHRETIEAYVPNLRDDLKPPHETV